MGRNGAQKQMEVSVVEVTVCPRSFEGKPKSPLFVFGHYGRKGLKSEDGQDPVLLLL